MISTALLLLLVLDPIGNLVTINTLLAEFTPAEKRWITLREGAIATFILMLAALCGGVVLDAIGLQEHSLRLAGGIVLFLIALGMIFPNKRVFDDSLSGSPLIVPIAMPLIAGPSAISVVIVYSQKLPLTTVCGGVLIAAGVSVALLACSSWVFQTLGRRGAMALERLMGMLLIMIAVQMLLDGFDKYLDLREAAAIQPVSQTTLSAERPS